MREFPRQPGYERTEKDMTETIITAVITGGMALIGSIIASSKAQAVTDTKLEALTREVRENNEAVREVPVMKEQIKVINHRLDDLEEYHK